MQNVYTLRAGVLVQILAATLLLPFKIHLLKETKG